MTDRGPTAPIRMKMRRTKTNRTKWAMLLLCGLCLTACGGWQGQKADATGTVRETAAKISNHKEETFSQNGTAAAAGFGDVSANGVAGSSRPFTLKLASTLAPDMVTIRALSGMAEDIYARSDGRLRILLYPSSQLGDQTDYLRAVQQGTVELCLISPTPLTEYDPRFVVFGCPGFFESSEEMTAFYETELSKGLFEDLRNESGIRYLGLFHEGMRDVWLTGGHRIAKVEDFAGIRLRVPDVPLSICKFEALGMIPIPMSLSEVYTGLQTGAVDGIENNVEVILGNRLQDSIRYRVKTNHTYSTLVLLANESVLSALDADLRTLLTECVRECAEHAYADFLTEQEHAYRAAEEAGIETVELGPAEKEKMNAIWQQVSEEVLDGLFDESVYEVVASCRR